MDEKLTDDQISKLLYELRAGRKLAAVKLYKEWTGSSLLVAKNSVESLAEGKVKSGDDLYSNLDEKVMDDVLDAIQKGDKLEAVKRYKESSGASLMESKEFVERLMSELGIEDQHRAGCAGMLLAAFIAVATLITIA